MASASSSGTGPAEIKIVSEISEELRKALLMTVNTFYSPEQAIIVYYIMLAVCISEENLRVKLCMDQKQLRQLMVRLKQDKLLKERQHTQKSSTTGKNQTAIYYFVNYKAITNVFKYKLHHIRTRIESKASNVAQIPAYKCSGCEAAYETSEMDRIMDKTTFELKCWRCQSPVESHNVTRSTDSQGTIAQFNVQMRPLFELLQVLEGTQLASHLCEPDLDKFIAMEKEAVEMAAAEEHTKQQQEKVTVDMNAGEANEVPVGKAMPIWLQANPDGHEAPSSSPSGPIDELDEAAAKAEGRIGSSLSLHELAAFENDVVEPEVKRARLETSASDTLNMPVGGGEGTGDAAMDDDDVDDDEEEEQLAVQGVMHSLSDISPEMVDQMTADEKIAYSAAAARATNDFY